MDLKSKIILISGPTASGKSNFSIKLAKQVNGEIINADSMQVFKEIAILSARPKDYKNIRHHLYGFVSVKKNFSTGQWLRLVEKKIAQITQKKKIPILVGGTGLYLKSVLNGLAIIPNITQMQRTKIVKLYDKIGKKSFFQKLIKLDPNCKNKISPNDKQRMIRFYEVKFYTKKSIFLWQKQSGNNLKDYSFVKIFLNLPRSFLLKKVNKRFAQMIADGALREVKKFNRFGLSGQLTANNVLGLKELTGYLNGISSLDYAVERSIIRTRQYIKRQMTWFRGQMKDWKDFDDQKKSDLKKKVLNFIRTT
jgi:tRNA dimethylallyltransferase